MVSTLPSGPEGFKPVRHQNGGVIRAKGYTIAAAYGTNIFAGDLVSTTGTGRNIQVAVTTAAIRGVFMGCQFVDSFGNARFEKAWTAALPTQAGVPIVALVYDDPLIVFKCFTDLNTLTSANLNAYYGFAGQANGSLLTGMSAEVLTSAGHTATPGATKGLFAYDLTAVPGNDYGGYTEFEVFIVQHELIAPWTQTATGS
jgi:hypothetical protein